MKDIQRFTGALNKKSSMQGEVNQEEDCTAKLKSVASTGGLIKTSSYTTGNYLSPKTRITGATSPTGMKASSPGYKYVYGGDGGQPEPYFSSIKKK